MIRRVVFLGNNDLGVKVLKFLKGQQQQLVGLVVHPRGKAKKRKMLIQLAKLPKNKIFEGELINDPQTIKQIKALEPDILVSVMFGYILKKEVLGAARFGGINLHPAYLPYNRGAHPNVWSIVEGTPAGVTLHTIDAGIDTGKILAQEKVGVEPIDTGKTLYQRLENAAYELFIKTWPKLVKGEIKTQPQPKEGSFHSVKDLQETDEINLNKKYTGKDLINTLRARTFPPHEGAYFKVGTKKIFVRVRLSAWFVGQVFFLSERQADRKIG